MGTKRGNGEEKLQQPLERPKKRKKEEHEKDRENVHVEETDENNSMQIKLQLIQLQKLTESLRSNYSVVKEVVNSMNGNHDIAKSIKKLNKAFDDPSNAPLRYSLTQPPLAPPPAQSSTTRTGNEKANKQASGIGSLPPLPSIKDDSLKKAIFTHAGIGQKNPTSKPGLETSYDRLELLGDAYIEVIATRLIWERFPELSAGKMSQIRETLIKNETLAQYTTAYGLIDQLRVLPGLSSHLKLWVKIKGDLFEAYVAGVILSDSDHGFETAETWLWQLWSPKLTDVKVVSLQPQQENNGKLTYKELLSRKIVSRGIKIRYLDEKPCVREGGLVTFFIGVYLTGWGYENKHLGSGTGFNKSEAGVEAAKQALNNQPLIDQIGAMKREFDEKVKAEKEMAEKESVA